MFYHWPRDHEDYLIDNDRILDLVAVAGTISISLSKTRPVSRRSYVNYCSVMLSKLSHNFSQPAILFERIITNGMQSFYWRFFHNSHHFRSNSTFTKICSNFNLY